MFFKSSLEKFTNLESRVYSLHFPIPDEIAEKFISGTDKRVKCIINDLVTIQSGLMSNGSYWYLLTNESNIKKLKIKEGDSVNIVIEKDDSQYGMEMPEELQACLDQNEQAQKYFDALTPGKQRNLIYIVSKVKSTDSRINKSLAITDHLVLQSGKLDFKKLNDILKQYSQNSRLQ